MKLIDLNPEWMRWEDRVITRQKVPPEFNTSTDEGQRAWRAAGYPSIPETGPVTHLITVSTMDEAQGIEIDCPKCQQGHRIGIAFVGRGVLDHQATRDSNGAPTRWSVVNGHSLENLSLSPSIDCTKSNPACWHGFITNGEIT